MTLSNPQAQTIWPTTRCYLLELPYELLYEIIQLTQPLGFESLILTCKHAYQVGKPLISEYNWCREWAKSNEQSTPHTLREELLQAPMKLQPWLLRYIRHSYNSLTMGDFTANSIENSRKNIQTPWLFDQFLEVCNAFPTIAKRLNQEDDFGMNSKLPKQCINFNNMSILLLLDSVETLIIAFDKPSLLHISWAHLITLHQGKRYFQNLVQLKLGATTQTTYPEIAVWSRLPKLQGLMVQKALPNRPWSVKKLDDAVEGNNVQISSLKHLVLLNASTNVELLRELLHSLPFLQTFVWEDGSYCIPSRWNNQMLANARSKTTQLENQQSSTVTTAKDRTLLLLTRDRAGAHRTGDMDMNFASLLFAHGRAVAMACRAKSVEETRDDLWESLIEYDSDAEKEDDEFDVGWKAQSDPPFKEWAVFRPNLILQLLEQNLAHTLRHLVLTASPQLPTIVLRHNRIRDFKAFTVLAHLEVDAIVLRSIRGYQSDVYPHCVVRSLTKVLPYSLQTFRMTMRAARFQNLHGMLRKIPSEKHKFFPDLRRIDISYVEAHAPFEISTRMALLKAEFDRSDVMLALKELKVFEYTRSFYDSIASKDWGVDPSFFDKHLQSSRALLRRMHMSS